MGDLHLRCQPLVGILGHGPIIHSYLFVPSPGLMVGQQDPKWDPAITSSSRWLSRRALGVPVLPLPIRESDLVITAILLTQVYALWDCDHLVLWSLLFYYFGFAGFAAVR